MNGKENIANNEGAQSEIETVKEWLAELDKKITEKIRFLETISDRARNNIFYGRLKIQVEEELSRLRSTYSEYRKLLEEAEKKR